MTRQRSPGWFQDPTLNARQQPTEHVNTTARRDPYSIAIGAPRRPAHASSRASHSLRTSLHHRSMRQPYRATLGRGHHWTLTNLKLVLTGAQDHDVVSGQLDSDVMHKGHVEAVCGEVACTARIHEVPAPHA